MPTVTLHDGRQVDVSSEDWRHECEARTVLSWPLHERKEYLIGVGEKRDLAARKRLEATMTALWIKRKAENLADASPTERAELLAEMRRENRDMAQRAMEFWTAA